MQVITRKLISQKIDMILRGNLSLQQFGEEMFHYLAVVGEKYKFEEGYEKVIEQTLLEFIDLHDVGKKGTSYALYVPSRVELIRIKNRLIRGSV